MFSMMGASIFLPFFPMMPGQILVNNFLYDLSQLSIPSDNVDPEYLKKPKHWDISFVKKFMLIFGPISSLFDFLTFFVLYKIFSLSGGAFQAAWFVESLATQVFVVYIIRTKKLPFFQSRPSVYLLMSTIGIVALGIIITLSPLANLLGFVAPGWPIFISITIIVILYLLVTESLKQIFYRKLANKHQGV
jgi:Mg2+-importing ATPase